MPDFHPQETADDHDAVDPTAIGAVGEEGEALEDDSLPGEEGWEDALPDDEAIEEIIAESEQALSEPPPSSNDSMSQYLYELQRYPVLEPEQERRLAELARQGSDRAKQSLVQHNLRFVITVARRYPTRTVSLEDLIQQGNIGLLKAVERFDPAYEVKFISYAVYWINQSIRSWLATHQRTMRLPVNRATQLARIRRFIARRRRETNEDPTPPEIAEACDISLKMVRDLLKVDQAELSLDAPMGGEEEGGVRLIEQVGDDADLDGELETWSRREVIERALGHLRERDARVVRLFYGLDRNREYTLQEIGNELGVTRERVRQIRDRALADLRELGMARMLRDYAERVPSADG